MNEYKKLKEFIEEDIAEKGIGHGEIADFDPQKLLNGETIMTTSAEFGPKHSKLKVAISRSDINFENAIDVYIADFGSKEVNVYYLDE